MFEGTLSVDAFYNYAAGLPQALTGNSGRKLLSQLCSALQCPSVRSFVYSFASNED